MSARLPDTLEDIAAILVEAVGPLRRAVSDLPSFQTFLRRLGWRVTSLPPAWEDLGARIDGALAVLEALRNGTATVESVLAEAKGLYDALKAIADSPGGVDEATFIAEVRVALFDLLLVDYLATQTPTLFGALRILGAIESEYHKPSGDRPAFLVHRTRFDELRRVLNEPNAVIEKVMGWGTAKFDFDLIAGYLLELFAGLEIPAAIAPVPGNIAPGFQGDEAVAERPISEQLVVRLVEVEIAGRLLTAGFRLLDLPPEDTSLPGLLLQPLLPIDLPPEFSVRDQLRVRIRPGSDLESAFAVAITPSGISVRHPFDSTAEVPPQGFGATLEYRPGTELTLLGRRDRARLVFTGTTAAITLDRFPGGLDFKVSFAVDGLTLVLPRDDGDSFLRTLLGEGDSRLPMALQVQWSSRKGFGITGGAGFEWSSAVHLNLGPVTVHRVSLAAATTVGTGHPPDLLITAGASLGGALGPVSFSLDDVGLRLTTVFQDGNAGPFNVEVGFKPPDGIGLSVDAGPITGGGFLSFDSATGRYAGALELEVYEISVKAIGLLDTRVPGGRPEYSFLIIVTTEFTPIQLGFGFTLNGVGGLAGIHRRIVVEELRTRLREGSLDSVLFPEDPIRDAAKLVTDLQSLFPPAENRHVFGPMAIIGWGTPPLIEGELGILLELPAPARLVLLGQFRIGLPRKETKIIELNLDIVGEIDQERQRIALDGRLRDSRVVSFPLEGDMAMRLLGGNRPNFALAIGGFNPAYKPPSGFPQLQRVTVKIGIDDNPRVTLEGYLALTSNTLQIGARATVYAEKGWFNISGEIGFNALFIFKPFSFVTDFSGKVALRKGSTDLAAIKLDAIISGPTPWHVAGEACLEIRWFPDICVGFDATFGHERHVGLPPVDPWPLLKEAVENPESWSGVRPAGAFRAATFAKARGPDGQLVDPAHGISLRQTIVPLNRRVTKFGEAQPPGGSARFDVLDVTAGGHAIPRPPPVQEFFAPAQFEQMSDDEKLSRPSFERMDAGFAFAGESVSLPTAVGASIEFETKIIDSAFETRDGGTYSPTLALELAAASRAAAARSALRSGVRKFAPPPAQRPLVRLDDEQFVVASTLDLSHRSDVTGPVGKGAAYQALAQYLVAHPHERGGLEVMSLDELPIGA